VYASNENQEDKGIMIDLKNYEPQEILNQFSYLTNNLVFKVNKTAEEYRDSSLMEELDLCWIRKLCSSDYHTDLRNEESAKVGRLLAAIPFVAKKLELPTNPKVEEVAEKMSHEHRTIQQSFSKLIFYHFWITCSQRESKILTDIMGEDFYSLPLI